ncbi:MAG: hypothetical protein HOH13_04645 [Crocinitomicaceae bacterium]|nr:hypothetical protein [Crocinitomicaceae bacterium]
MRSKKMLFTFDYELFLGANSGSVENCLLKPTNKVVALLEKFELHGIFFVDTLYLVRLKEAARTAPKAATDFKLIQKQLVRLLNGGHCIYPHVHPHWLDASYDAELNTWSLQDLSKYRFHSLTEQQRTEAFDQSMDCLSKMLQNSTATFSINAYRAGGWSIQPFSDFAKLFDKYNIIADFSVLGGSRRNTNALSFDFSSIQPNSFPYRFNNQVDSKSPDGKYLQFPISSLAVEADTLTNRMMKKILWRIKHGQNYGDGKGVEFVSNEKPSDYDKHMEMLSFELLTLPKLKQYCSFINDNDYVQFISHPKMLSPHNLLIFKRLLSIMTGLYQLESDWRNINI